MKPSDEFAALLARKCEARDLDFKGPLKFEDSARFDIFKDVVAIANTSGGSIIVGVEEMENGVFTPIGCSPEEVESFESTKLNQFINQHVDPTINCEVSVEGVEDKRFVWIRIPHFPETPHICVMTKNDSKNKLVFEGGAVFVRSDNNATTRVSRASDMRNLIQSAVRKQQDYLLHSMRAILEGQEKQAVSVSDDEKFKLALVDVRERCSIAAPILGEKERVTLSCWSWSSQYRPDAFEYDSLFSLVQEATTNITGWPFLYVKPDKGITRLLDDAIETVIDHSLGQDCWDYWILKCNGLFFHRTLPRGLEPKVYFQLANLIAYPYQAILNATRLYSVFEPSEPITISIELSGSNGKKLAELVDGQFESWGYECHTQVVNFSDTLPLAEWKAGLEDHTKRAYRHISKRFSGYEPSDVYAKYCLDRMLRRR